MKRQLAFLLARAQIPLEWLHPPTDDNADADADAEFQEELPEDLLECLSNTRLYTHFRDFGKELGVADPKSLEDIYKSHLENTSLISSVSMSHFAYHNPFYRISRFCSHRFSTSKPCGNIRKRFCECWIWE